MKKAIFFILLFAAAANLSAQTFTEWHDAAVNEINRQQMHATFFAYESADAARRRERSEDKKTEGASRLPPPSKINP